METSGFYSDIGGDRLYTDDFLAEWVASFIASGVYDTELSVIAGENMQVILQPGRAWISGRYYHNTEALPIALDNSDGVLNRYTSIMIRADKNNRVISAKAINSPYSASPVPANVTRDSEVYDLKLADILVRAGTITISQADITDKRLDTSLCGIVYCPVDHIDTTKLSAQLESWFTQFTGSSTAEFQTWFDSINNILDENAAGNLLNLINTHKTDTIAHITADERTAWDGKAEKSDIPAALKNPNALTFAVGNGGTADTYDGSVAKTVSIPKVTLSTTATPSYTIAEGELYFSPN